MWQEVPSHVSYRAFVPWESIKQINPIRAARASPPHLLQLLDGMALEARANLVPARVHTHSKRLIPRGHYENTRIRAKFDGVFGDR